MTICANCGEENPDRARFCLACGTPLVAEPSKEVRKTVTVVFTDVTGSTELGERLDPEALRRVMSRYFDRMREVVERHGGTVEKFIGDAIMAVFGVPVLHEDDALRAVTSATEMQAALDELNAELERGHGVGLEVRIGVNTGEVVAGDSSAGQSFATGDAVNVAARLEQAAAPGEILIAETTHRLVREAVRSEPRPPLTLKGKEKPVAAHRLLEVLPTTSFIPRRLDSPMVGRDQEAALMTQAFERVVRERRCHLFTLLGAAGVGKSRLITEVIAGVEDQATVLTGRCLHYGEGITFYPVIEAVRQAAGITDTDSSGEAQTKIAALLEEEQDAPLIAGRVTQVLGLGDTAGSPEETFWAVRKLLESLARRRPLVVVFDDVHWAEPTFLDLIEHVADWSREAPILLACLGRPELLDVRTGWGGGKLNATTILLEPLTEPECERLIDNLLGAAGISDDARERIAEAAEGNPLFVEEMLSMLIDDGLLRRDDGHWVPTRDLSSVSVPPTIQALLSARLDRLQGEERAVLERASVVGKVFYRGAVAELSPEPVRPQVGNHLMTLVRKELIRPDRSEFTGDDAFRFRHILTRDAAYGSMPKQTRAELHERFAAWLEHASGEHVTEYEEIIGYHLEQAYRYLAELGPIDERGRSLAGRAAERLVASGRRAYSRGDMGATSNLLGRAADLLPVDAQNRPRVLFDLARALIEIGELVRAQETFEESADLAGAGGDRSLEARARLQSTFSRLFTDPTTRMENVLAEADRAILVFEEVGDNLGLAQALNVLGSVLFWLGRAGDAEVALERAFEAARRVGSQHDVAENRSMWLAASMWGPREATEGIDRARAVVEEMKGGAGEGMPQDALGMLLAMRGQFDEARAAIAAGDVILEEFGMKVHLAASHAFAEVELLADHPGRVEERVRAGLAILEQMGETGFWATSACNLAEALYRLGRYDEAQDLSRTAEEKAASDDFDPQVRWRSIRAKTMARRGEFNEAERLAREAVTWAGKTDYPNLHAGALMDLAEVLNLAGRADEVAPLVDQAIELYERKGNVVSAERARSRLAELTG